MQIKTSIKSLTGPKTIVQMWNQLGHSVSYSVVEEVEKELTCNTNKQEKIKVYIMSNNPDALNRFCQDLKCQRHAP